MKISIPQTLSAALQARAPRLKRTLSEVRRTAEARDANEAALEELPEKIELAERNCDVSDEKSTSAIASDKNKLAAAQRQQQDRDREHADALEAHRAELDATTNAVQVVIAHLSPLVEARVAKHLSVVMEENEARALVRQTATWRAFTELACCRFAGIADPSAATEEALRIIQVLLSEELPIP